MINESKFAEWLKHNTVYSDKVIRDNVSRMKRADKILKWNAEPTYLFFLEKNEQYKPLSVSVRSQIKKSVTLYSQFTSETENN